MKRVRTTWARGLAAGCVLGLLVVTGCNQQTASDAQEDSTPAAVAKRTGPSPSDVVSRFLDAMRTEKVDRAEKLLTDRAVAEMNRHNHQLSSLEFGKAKYVIGDFREEGDVAFVTCQWTDIDESTGRKRTDQIEFLLKHKADGWRIFGYACQPFEDWDSVVFSFEDFATLSIRAREVYEEGIRRRRGESSPTAVAQTPELDTTTRTE